MIGWGKKTYWKACMYFFFCINQRGDSGQKKIPMTSGTAGMKALPNWSRHASGLVMS
jgi:hypothetical protein